MRYMRSARGTQLFSESTFETEACGGTRQHTLLLCIEQVVLRWYYPTMVLNLTKGVDTELPLAALLRGARSTIGRVIRAALEDAGFGDLPANGPFVMSAMSQAGMPLSSVISGLRLSKQAAGHLVDILVLRGYLERRVDPEDRRRLVVLPTDRGAAAAQVIRQAADRLEARLVDVVGDAALKSTRRTLLSLATLDEDD